MGKGRGIERKGEEEGRREKERRGREGKGRVGDVIGRRGEDRREERGGEGFILCAHTFSFSKRTIPPGKCLICMLDNPALDIFTCNFTGRL